MSSRSLFEYNRRNPNLRKSKIREVLPGYYSEEYPALINFLETYYEALDDPNEIINTLEYELLSLRDLDEINLQYIDRLFYEIANGAGARYFTNPRLIGKLFNLLLQNKGNEFSTNLFFEFFFSENVDIIYPKNNILKTFSGDSSKLEEAKIGVESLRYIQDGLKYQLLSIALRSGKGINEWGDLYKRFVHPAGYYLSSEIGIETTASLNITGQSFINEPFSYQITIEPGIVGGDSAGGGFGIDERSRLIVTNAGFSEFASQYQDDSDNYFYFSLNETVKKYDDALIGYIDSHYDDFKDFNKLTSHTFDEDSGQLSNKFLELSTDLETMDNATALSTFTAAALADIQTISPFEFQATYGGAYFQMSDMYTSIGGDSANNDSDLIAWAFDAEATGKLGDV